MLLIEVDGAESQMESSTPPWKPPPRRPGCVEFRAARDEQETAALWTSRKALSPALRKIAPKKINEDVVVPVSRMADFIGRLAQLSKQYGIANRQLRSCRQRQHPREPAGGPGQCGADEERGTLPEGGIQTVLDMHGTLSGEHGVGMEKRPIS